MAATPAQIRGARSMLSLTQARLAMAAGVSTVTVNFLEAGGEVKVSTLQNVQMALEDRGAIFAVDGGVRIGPPLAEKFYVAPGAKGDREGIKLAMAIVNLKRRRLGLRPLILDEEDE